MDVPDVDTVAGSSATPLEGRDGWLFLDRADSQDVVGLYTDEDALAATTIQLWVSALSRRREHFERNGIAYQTLVVPEAHVVYRDKLPDGVKLAERSPFQRLYDALDEETRAQCVYPLDELVAGRESDETYQSVDSLWTDWGAWLGYLASVEAVATTVPNVRVLDNDDLDWSVRSTFGTLGAIVTPPRSATMPAGTVRDPASKVTITVVTELGEEFLVLAQDAPDLPTAAVFRDSFMTAPATFFAESFRRVVFVSSAANTLFYDLLDWEKPDVVIHEIGERRLVTPPVEPSTLDFRFTFGDLLLDDPQAMADQRRSRSLARVGRVDEALTASDDVLGRVPPNARLLVRRAQLHLRAGQPAAAVEALRHATTLEPTDGTPWFSLGQAFGQQGRVNDSAHAHARAARVEPRHVAYWHLAISAALRAKDLTLAEELRSEAMALHGDNPQLAGAASWVLAATDRLEEAEEEAEYAARGESGTAEALWQLASIQIRRQRWDAAGGTVKRLWLLTPDDPEVKRYLDVVRRASRANSPATEG